MQAVVAEGQLAQDIQRALYFTSGINLLVLTTVMLYMLITHEDNGHLAQGHPVHETPSELAMSCRAASSCFEIGFSMCEAAGLTYEHDSPQ